MSNSALQAGEWRELDRIVKTVIETGCKQGSTRVEPSVHLQADFGSGSPLVTAGASFVTLKQGAELRGCIGSLMPVTLLW
ncbi:MAG: AMMECR1 domain-containing protein, partial [Leptospiraceae bacterium]|nr:AMMECR1 domain-containing protein [Leptospiraceae bacterium]